MAGALTTPRGPEELSASVLNALDLAESHAKAVIASIPKMTDDALLQVHDSAKALGSVAWRIECAAADEIVQRAEKRGEKESVIADAAQSAGVSTRTLYRNAQINRLIANCPDTDLLDEKQYWVEALAASDPHKAIEVIANKKAANATYSPSNARDDIALMRSGQDSADVEAVVWLRIPLSPKAHKALVQRCSTSGRKPVEILEQMLLGDGHA